MTPKLGKLDYSKTSVDALAKWAQQGEPKRTAAQANRERVAAALGKWLDEGAKKKPKNHVVAFKIPSVWWSDSLRTGSRRISIYIEVKPRTYSIGSVLRQIKTYRMTVGDSSALFCLASRGLTNDHATILLAERIIPWQPIPQPPSLPSGFFRLPDGR